MGLWDWRGVVLDARAFFSADDLKTAERALQRKAKRSGFDYRKRQEEIPLLLRDVARLIKDVAKEPHDLFSDKALLHRLTRAENALMEETRSLVDIITALREVIRHEDLEAVYDVRHQLNAIDAFLRKHATTLHPKEGLVVLKEARRRLASKVRLLVAKGFAHLSAESQAISEGHAARHGDIVLTITDRFAAKEALLEHHNSNIIIESVAQALALAAVCENRLRLAEEIVMDALALQHLHLAQLRRAREHLRDIQEDIIMLCHNELRNAATEEQDAIRERVREAYRNKQELGRLLGRMNEHLEEIEQEELEAFRSEEEHLIKTAEAMRKAKADAERVFKSLERP